MSEQQYLDQIRDEVSRRLFDESIPRIKKCMRMLSVEQIWQRPNESLVSIGNLTLHCIGNARQWIGSTLGGLPDNRVRDAEFEETGPIPMHLLEEKLDQLEQDLRQILAGLDSDAVLNSYNVQGFDETGISILIHVVEHFSYHVGQISWFTKLLLNTDLEYYGGMNLNITGTA